MVFSRPEGVSGRWIGALLALSACTQTDSLVQAPAWQDVEPLRVTSSGQLRAAKRDLVADLDEAGLHLRHAGGDLGLRLTRWGRTDRPVPAWGTSPVAEACVHIPGLPECLPGATSYGDGIDSWWLARAQGVEQGWTLAQPPAGAGELLIELRIDGGSALSTGDGVLLLGDSGGAWRMSGLVAWDDAGRALPARVDVGRERLRLRVDDRGATWPVVIDPLLSSAAPRVSPSYDAAGLGFGASMARMGDSDGDGQVEVLIGDALGPDGAGRAALFEALDESETLLLSTPAGFACGDGEFGATVASAGDVNGDDFDDLLVGQGGGSCAPAWHLYLGGPAGPAAAPATSWTDAWTGQQAAVGVGDLDGDGKGDIVGLGDGGLQFLRGTETGAEITPWGTLNLSLTDLSDAIVRGLGDLDADGLVDFAVGAPAHNGTGVVLLVEADPAGTAPALTTSLFAPPGSVRFGASIAGGDANGDDLDDLVVGDPGLGVSWLYVADAGGFSPFPVPLFTIGGAEMGTAVAATDLDADGRDDLVVAGSAGFLSVFRGSEFGAFPTGCTDCFEGHTALLGIDDADFDGFDDLLAADPASGAVLLHRGCEDADLDGWCADVDCDDLDVARNPGQTEIAGDGVDADCDDVELCYRDIDGDGWVRADGPTVVSTDGDCGDPGEASITAFFGDCDDTASEINPDRAEVVANGVDDNCDNLEICWTDGDRDGHRVNLERTSDDLDCEDPGEASELLPAGDCDDGRAAVNPGATEQPANGRDEDCDGFELCATDADDDGYRTNIPRLSADLDCTDPGEGLPGDPGGDCDDADAAVSPGETEAIANGLDDDCDGLELCHHDADLDGWLASGAPTLTSADLDCTDPGESSVAGLPGDCDDDDGGRNPGVPEEIADGIDQDCSGGDTCWTDSDGDGFRTDTTRVSADLDCSDPGEASEAASAGDCNDALAFINPGATELPANGRDDDCNGFELCGTDADDDGYRSDAPFQSVDLDCTDPGEATPADPGGDCDDARADVNPGEVEEAANGRDDDCDGLEVCFHDADRDGWLALGAPTITSSDLDCEDAGESATGGLPGDCDDTSDRRNPGVPEEIADGIDQNCSGGDTCWADGDGDGYRSDSTIISSDLDCADSGEATALATPGDCNDAIALVHPGATDVPGDSSDSDCDGVETCWTDADGDGFRTDVVTTSADLDCFDLGEADAFALGGDCDDTTTSVRPGATDLPADGIDSNCDGTEQCRNDADGDGWASLALPLILSDDTDCTDPGESMTASAGDCDDSAAAVNPGATEVAADGIDSDCNGRERCWADADDDGFRGVNQVDSADGDCADRGEADESVPDGDCNDGLDAIFPGAPELVGDGRDSDCDGLELCWQDADGDRFRTDTQVVSDDADCIDAGESVNAAPAGDCDDEDPRLSPGATEEMGDGIDNDCDGTELCAHDEDGDGWTPLDVPFLLSEDLDCDDPGEAASGEAGDCDDAAVSTYPEAEEIVANGVDEDCDGVESCWIDLDGDGFRRADPRVGTDLDCTDPGEVTDAVPPGDCDDSSAVIFPAAADTIGDGIDSDCDGAELCWFDLDDDGVRAIEPALSVDTDCADEGEVPANRPGGDCDDNDGAVRPGGAENPGDGIDGNCNGREVCFLDVDGDGWLPSGGPTLDSEDLDCDDPTEAASADQVGDCDDNADGAYPGAEEVPNDGIDSDCDGVESCWVDIDNDGFRGPVPLPGLDLDCTDPGEVSELLPSGDCDDGDIAIFPGAAETTGDGIDSACDGNEVCFVDADSDGFLADIPGTLLSADGDCADPGEAPPGTPFGDCDDEDAGRNPGAVDVPGSRVDENCDGLKSCLQDVDDDGYLGTRPTTRAPDDGDCDDPNEGWADDPANDCNDNDPAIRPGAEELPNNNLDSNCDGFELCRVDQDDDGFYNATAELIPLTDLRCRGDGYATANALPGDCDDSDRDFNPASDDDPDDGIDHDCDGKEVCYADQDVDGYRAARDGTVLSDDMDCDDPGEAHHSMPRNDCDDLAATAYPGAPEIPGNLRDEDCNGSEVCLDDDDGDGFIDLSGDTRPSNDMDCRDPNEATVDTPTTDCDDSRPDLRPGGRELVADGIDGDCDGKELCLQDVDDDGFLVPEAVQVLSDDVDCDDPFEGSLVDPITDCDDQDATRNPDAPEVAINGLDEDCDGADSCFDDDDGDGFLDSSGDVRRSDDFDCTDPFEGDEFMPTTDCDDADAEDNPDAVEIVGNGDDEDCDGTEICLHDDDDDGFLDEEGDTVLSADRDCRDPFEAASTEPTSDCDDSDPNRFLGADEEPGDGVDGDCDGQEMCYVDADNDGHAEATGDTVAAPDGDCSDRGEATASDPIDDCDDSNADRYPGAVEEPGDEIDGDCNGAEICFLDADGDRVLDGNGLTRPSQDPDCRDQFEGSLNTPVGDCDDSNRNVRPGAPEVDGDGFDSDCNGEEACYVDNDGDGYRTSSLVPGNDADCDDPGEASVSLPAGDCDDRNAAVNPGAEDTPGDGRDGNCDGSDACYADEDDDGWRTQEAAMGTPDGDCDDPGEARRNEPSGDCDDQRPDINPDVVEVVGDGVDQDCDGHEQCRVDNDGDDWTTGALMTSEDVDCDDPGESSSESVEPDCDDSAFDINPGRAEVPADDVDQDCDGRELCYEDRDDDGWRTRVSAPSPDGDCDDPGEATASEPDGDCADGDPAVHPEAVELVASGVDEDCDGRELCYVDVDGDGWRPIDDQTIESRDATCDGQIEASAAAPSGDCDDTTPWVNPVAIEITADGIDQDCDGKDKEPEEKKKTFLGISCSSSGAAPTGAVGLLLVAAAWRRRRPIVSAPERA